MADKQAKKGDMRDDGAQQEETDHSDSDLFHSDSESDLFLSTELSKPQSGENGDHLSLVLLILTPLDWFVVIVQC